MDEYLYRVEDYLTAGMAVDEFENYGPSTVNIRYLQFVIVRRTPKGAWINVYGEHKFVNLNAYKKFACATKEDALTSFLARKEKLISIMEARIKHAVAAIYLVKPCEKWDL